MLYVIQTDNGTFRGLDSDGDDIRVSEIRFAMVFNSPEEATSHIQEGDSLYEFSYNFHRRLWPNQRIHMWVLRYSTGRYVDRSGHASTDDIRSAWMFLDKVNAEEYARSRNTSCVPVSITIEIAGGEI